MNRISKMAFHLLSLIFFISVVNISQAKDMLVNDYVLKDVLNAIQYKGAVAKDIDYFGNIESITLSNKPGYSSALKTTVRAQGFPGSTGTVEVYSLPTVFYFPDNPTRDPLLIEMHTVKVNDQIYQKVLDSAEVKVPYGALNGKKSPWIVYGQTVLDNTETTLTYQEQDFLLQSTINIASMSKKDASSYFEQYQGLISSLNAELRKMNSVHYSEVYERESKEAEKDHKKVLAQTYTEIKDKQTFSSILGYMGYEQAPVENPSSEFGHWSYKNIDASDDVNVKVNVINYGKHYELSYRVTYDEALDDKDRKADLQAMINTMNEKISGNLPKGAHSVEAKLTKFYGLADIVATYKLEGGKTGKDIYKSREDFDKFLNKTYKKMQKIADKAN